MSRIGRKIGSCLVASTMFLYWSVVIAQGVVGGGVNHCGDGVLREDLGEMCDDGNYYNGDGCSHNCEIEGLVSEYVSMSTQFNIDSVSETTTYKVFMHGEFSHTIEIENGSEVCDYGVDNGVLCEPGYGGTCYFCTTSCTLEEVQGASCGDGIVHHLFEECDDGNIASGDGCSSTCSKENILIIMPLNTSQEGITDVVDSLGEPPVIHDLMPEVEQEQVIIVEQVPVAEPLSEVVPQENYVVEVPRIDEVEEVVLVNMTPLVLEASVEDVVPVTVSLEEKVVENETTYVPEEINFRQNMIMRTSPVHSGIGITDPYPENLSQTGVSSHIPSHVLFMWLLSCMLTIYTASFFFTKNG